MTIKALKEKIALLIEEIGFGPLDTGVLKDGSRLQGVQGILYNRELSVKAARMMIKDEKITK